MVAALFIGSPSMSFSRSGLGLFLLLAFGGTGHAADDGSSQMSLTERAHQEILQPGKIKTTPSDVSVSESMLSLSDPKPVVEERAVQFGFSLGAQPFHAKGVVGEDLTGSSFDIGGNGQTVLPTAEFGIRHGLVSGQGWRSDWGLAALFAYTSQKAKAEFVSGFVEKDVRLNTMLWSLGPQATLTLERWSRLTGVLGLEFGQLTYTQVSSDELANFTRRGAYFGWNLGLEFQLSQTWSLMGRYTRRELTGSHREIDIQADNYALGAKIVW
jgi:hypothetical protein